MKDYKRFTRRSEVGALYITGIDGKKCSLLQADAFDRDYCLAKFEELEDKIESGELCDREEVRKETAKEIYNWLVEYSYDEESRQLVKAFHESFLEGE